MKKSLLGALAIIFSLPATNAWAEPETPWFAGAFLGDSSLAINARTYIDNESEPPLSYSFKADDSQTLTFTAMGGYRFTDMIGIEGQFSVSAGKDKVFDATKVNNSALSELNSSISAMGAYALFYFGGDAYFKGRIGLATASAKLETDFADYKPKGSGISYGISVGQKMGGLGSVELMYMRYPDLKVENMEFTRDFSSEAPYGSYTLVSHDMKLEVLTLGYVFEF